MSKNPKYLENGMQFGRLTVIELDETSKIEYNKKLPPSEWKYKCKCSCGNITYVRKNHLCQGNTKSCGCLAKEQMLSFRKRNKIEIVDNTIKIFLSNTNNYAIIDIEDYDKIKNYCWRENTKKYARTRLYNSKNKDRILMHRLLLQPSDNVRIDHINGNGLDNRKCNLRLCTDQQNSHNRKLRKDNSSGYTGVYWDIKKHNWTAQITVNYEKIYLGSFSTKEEAIEARKKAEIKYYKEFIRQ